MTEPGECKSCPSDKALCSGGSNIGPKPGFWRKSNSSSLFIQCLYEPACLGMIEPNYDPIGSCNIGYQGVLCSDCQVGYSRTNDFECSKCPERSINIHLDQLLKYQFRFSVLIAFQIKE
ncbi:UNKNOWN [Stylonychia lemnae]|uniref:Tyrosine-protein kinase ephrin type A/B receptor-like domain-containing protein n=1 Tax=Stylonychia lemnae TaxID=5949 RepID=A0A078AT69_STYLE|nr:UNKNOWN [Stylonychia lemnae]|eukprot:CDW85655.1 UNKNOWN [Stylonychia lemnae]